MARYWTCRKCGYRNERVKQLCIVASCDGKRPKPSKPAHRAVLENPYEWWVERFGTNCNICGRAPAEGRKLHRDHDHKTGEARGLLCHLCNRALPSWITADWLKTAREYLAKEAS